MAARAPGSARRRARWSAPSISKAIHAKSAVAVPARVRLDECFECVAVRYAAALHPQIRNEPGGIVGVGQGARSASHERQGREWNVGAFGLPLESGRKTHDRPGRKDFWRRVKRAGRKGVKRRLGRWARDIGIESKKGTATATIVEGRPVVCISGCWYAAASALVDPEAPSKGCASMRS